MDPFQIDILKIPFKISETDQIDTFKSENHYEIRLIPKIDGKKLLSDELNAKNSYLLVENDQILAKSEGVYEFNTPYDFVIPQKTLSFEHFFIHLMDETSENKDSQNNINEKTTFEQYAPPFLSNSHLFENYDFKNIKTKIEKKRAITKYKLTDEEKENLEKKLKISHGDTEFNVLYGTLERIFNEKKIIRMNHTNFFTGNLSRTQIKKYMPLFAIFQSSGPWRKTWIKHEFNPTTDQTSFKMQKLTLNRRGKEICLEDHPFLIHELEQNKKKYLLEIPDGNGFLTQDGIDFINLHFDRSIVPDSINHKDEEFIHEYNESSEGSDFSLIDE